MKTFLLSLLNNSAPKVHKERFKESFVLKATEYFTKVEDGGPFERLLYLGTFQD